MFKFSKTKINWTKVQATLTLTPAINGGANKYRWLPRHLWRGSQILYLLALAKLKQNFKHPLMII